MGNWSFPWLGMMPIAPQKSSTRKKAVLGEYQAFMCLESSSTSVWKFPASMTATICLECDPSFRTRSGTHSRGSQPQCQPDFQISYAGLHTQIRVEVVLLLNGSSAHLPGGGILRVLGVIRVGVPGRPKTVSRSASESNLSRSMWSSGRIEVWR